MQTILVATDFSHASHNAALYAIRLAEALDARLVLFHAYKELAVPVADTLPAVDERSMLIQTRERLKEEALAIDSQNLVDVETWYKEGETTDMILEAAKETHASLIIAGIRKADYGLKRILGSTVTHLTKKTHQPLLLVPEDYHYTAVETIAMASEYDVLPQTGNHVIKMLQTIAKRFHSKIYLIRVTDNQLWKAYEIVNKPYELLKRLQIFEPVYECLQGKDITRELNEFIHTSQVNLLVMLPHKRNFWERCVFKSTTREMIFETQVPLLLLPDVLHGS